VIDRKVSSNQAKEQLTLKYLTCHPFPSLFSSFQVSYSGRV
jgi:hypothetical protein